MKPKLLTILLLLLTTAFAKADDVRFFNIANKFGTSMHEFFSLCKDGNGFVWASSRSEILRLTTSDYRSYRLPYKSKDFVFVEMASNGKEVVAYTNNKQLFRYDEVFDRFESVNLPTEINLWINEILIGEDGTYWIATRSGLYRYKDRQLILTGETNKAGEASGVPMIAWGEDGQLIFACNNTISLLNTATMEIERLC
ncbi:MAG: hybrid sensor histidine kinase/response regulator, partial [Tannerella sp.]|nr:hybrid sensor histidine kinase/response regulator [Tannerella sp.]